jgi:hypothetical protein
MKVMLNTKASSWNFPLRVVGAVAVLLIGYVHIKLYFDSYRHIDKIGPSFLLNAAASVVVAAALIVLRNRFSAWAALALSNATLLAFWLSRTSAGIFDFNEHGFSPSPEATLAVIAEVVAALIALALWYDHDRAPDVQ